MIELFEVSCGYGARRILHGVTARFANGVLTGVVGPNGCGKTTLLRAACGELSALEGAVRIDSIDIKTMKRRQRALKVARFQQERVIPDLTVRQLVEAGRYPHIPFARCAGSVDRDIIERAMQRCGAEIYSQRKLRALSGGERQRAYIAMLLAQQAPSILLDEPAAYLDPAARFEIMDLFRALARDGMAVCVVMHDIALALEYCDSIVVMEAGCVRAQQAPKPSISVISQVFDIQIHAAPDGAYAVAPARRN